MFVAWVIGVLYLPLGEVGYVFPIVFGVAGIGMGWLWIKDSTQGGLSYLTLTPEGFEFCGFVTTKSGKWEEIRNVADKLPDEVRFWNPMVITMKNGRRLLMEAPGTYTPNGTAIVDLVTFYWQHPQHRDELTDGRAVRHLAIPDANQPET